MPNVSFRPVPTIRWATIKLDLSIPEYGLHGTNVPWGIGMTVSHGCVRLYPEDIERLFSKTPVGTPGGFVYQPVKFGWRGGVLYVEVHDDLYGKYPGLWNLAAKEVRSQNLAGQVDMGKLEKLVEAKSGIPTYVGFGPTPPSAALPILTASDTSSESGASASSEGPSTAVPSSAALAPSTGVAPPASAGMSAPGAPAAPNEASTDDDAASNSALGPSTTIAPATTIGPSGPAGSSAASAPAPANDTSSDDDAATTPDNAGANPGPPSRDTSIVTGTAATVHRSTTIGTATVPAPTSASGPGLPTSIVKSADDDTDSGSDWEPTGRTNP